jgi:hypothetical protein
MRQRLAVSEKVVMTAVDKELCGNSVLHAYPCKCTLK